MRYLLHDVFLEAVGKSPEKNAIKEEYGKDLTYRELNNLSNKFAQSILPYKKDVKNNPFVGILSSVHSHSVAAILGVLKIGCAYVPLDEYSPTERLLSILENTKLDILVIDPIWVQNHHKLLSYPTLKKVILLDSDDSFDIPIQDNILSFNEVLKYPSIDPPLLNQVSDDLAYVLHTSGSTGIPKGIMLTHRNARTFVDWMHKEFKLNSEDVVMSRAPFKFDLSVFDIFNTFKASARLVCFNWNRKRERDKKHSDYVSLMAIEKATILYTTPSTFITLMNHGSLDKFKLSLTRIMYAGEPFPVPQLRRLKSLLPNTRMANIYGPTETNIITYYWIDELPSDDKSIPLGQEVEDTEIIIVNEDEQRLCDFDEIGELWCRGGTVTLGYLGLDEKTNQHKIKSPFHKYPIFYWRTGDYGYRDKNNVLHYRGRKDHMVKIMGYRIELGEIEIALSQYKLLDEFAVVVVCDKELRNKLYCYYSVLNNCRVEKKDLGDFLLKKIPEYMIPCKFIQKTQLPKTSSGKIDRVRLMEENNEL